MGNIEIKGVLEEVRPLYKKWFGFMEQEIDIWKVEKDWHTKPHCSRVLLLALILGRLNHLDFTEQEALAMAAVFHDSRRQDDWLDVGHGQRAADYYSSYCKEAGMACDSRTYYIMAYHDRDDALGLGILREKFPDDPAAVLLYQIFKDADALDRFRLGPDALDVKYLRTEEAKGLVEFSKTLLRDGPEKLLEGQEE